MSWDLDQTQSPAGTSLEGHISNERRAGWLRGQGWGEQFTVCPFGLLHFVPCDCIKGSKKRIP